MRNRKQINEYEIFLKSFASSHLDSRAKTFGRRARKNIWEKSSSDPPVLCRWCVLRVRLRPGSASSPCHPASWSTPPVRRGKFKIKKAREIQIKKPGKLKYKSLGKSNKKTRETQNKKAREIQLKTKKTRKWKLNKKTENSNSKA